MTAKGKARPLRRIQAEAIEHDAMTCNRALIACHVLKLLIWSKWTRRSFQPKNATFCKKHAIWQCFENFWSKKTPKRSSFGQNRTAGLETPRPKRSFKPQNATSCANCHLVVFWVVLTEAKPLNSSCTYLDNLSNCISQTPEKSSQRSTGLEPTTNWPGTRFSKSPETLRAIFGCHNSLCISRTERI